MARKKTVAAPAAASFTPNAETLGELTTRLVAAATVVVHLRDLVSNQMRSLDEHPNHRDERLKALATVDRNTAEGAAAAIELEQTPRERVERHALFLEKLRQEVEGKLEVFEGYLTAACVHGGLPPIKCGSFFWRHGHGFVMRLVIAATDAFRQHGRNRASQLEMRVVNQHWPAIAATLRAIPSIDIVVVGLRMQDELVLAQEMDARAAGPQYERMRKDAAVAKFEVSGFRVLRDDGRAIDDPPENRNSKLCLVRVDALADKASG